MHVNGPPIAWLPEGSKFQSENLGTEVRTAFGPHWYWDPSLG